LVNNSRFENLESSGEGGALRILNTNANITGCLFKDNLADKGGAIALLCSKCKSIL
jgi:hypothetical protein